MKHHWKLDEDGKIDQFAWDQGIHSGVICVDCGETVCTNCHPDYMDLDDCPGAPKKIAYTRADRMRCMTDAELAETILSIIYPFEMEHEKLMKKHMLEFLQEEIYSP
jgi:hypothetical protein